MQVRQFSGCLTDKMKFFVVFALVVACVNADKDAQILKFDSEVNPDGFAYAYETSNGIAENARGVLKNPNSDNAALEVTGEYRYPGDDGNTYQLNYIANEDGYQPSGAHLPTPPPVPEQIARALAYIAAHPPPADKFNQGSFGSAPVVRPPPPPPARARPSRPIPARNFPSSSFGARPFGF